MKGQITDWKNIFIKHIFDQRPASIIYKEYL